MIHKIAMAENEEVLETGSILSTSSSELEKLSLTSSGNGSSMSTVFGSEKAPSSSRTSSPSRKEGGRFSLHHRSSSHGGSADRQKRKDDHLARWLQGGNVIYKSVGLGLMDLTVGMKLIEYAKEKGVGSHIEGF
jgi:hypothetical protein